MRPWKTFDVDVVRNVQLAELAWPDEEEVEEGGWLGGNKIYYGLTKMSWTEVHDMLGLEAELIERIANAADPTDEEGILQDEMYEEGDLLYGLDIGIASPVIALSAAGCVPFSSCNGGVFGRPHFEEYPLVAFYAREEAMPLLLQCAEEAGVGLINGDEGEVVLHGRTIEHLRLFAETVMRKADRFDALKPRESLT